MFVGHHYFSLCFDCDKYSRSELTRCHNCKAPAHGEGTSVYFGTSEDLDVISGWEEKMHQLHEEHDQKGLVTLIELVAILFRLAS